MLREITTGKEVKILDCLSIDKVINMDIEVASDDELMMGGETTSSFPASH